MQHQDAGVGERCQRGGTTALIQRRHLSNTVSSPRLAQFPNILPAAYGYLDGSADDDEDFIGMVALPAQDIADSELPFLRSRRKLEQVIRFERRNTKK